MKRIYSFDVLKFVFALMIALYHFGVSLPGVSSAVQFFFIISGYFLAKKVYASRGELKTPWQYTVSHFRSLYPQYLFGLIVLYCYHFGYEVVNLLRYGVFSHRWIGEMNELRQFVSELLLLQNSGAFTGGLNYPLWQVCALLISGHFLYALLYHNRKLSENILIPASVLLALTYISASGADPFGTSGMFYIPLVRAYIGLGCGVLTYRFAISSYYQTVKRYVNILSLIALVLLFVYPNKDTLMTIISCVIILGLHDETSWLNRLLNCNTYKVLGKLSYAIYVNHALLIWAMLDIVDPLLEGTIFYNNVSRACIFAVLLVAYSVATVRIVEWIGLRKKK